MTTIYPHPPSQKPQPHQHLTPIRTQIYPTPSAPAAYCAVMRTAPQTISKHRLARLNVCARLTLVWLVGVIAAWWGEGGRAHPRALDRVAHGVGALIVLNAIERHTPLKPPKYRPIPQRRANLRAVIGADLRRALRAGDLPSRVMAILAVVRDAKHHIAKLLRRLRSGLTRLRIIAPKREQERVRCADIALALGADTS